MSLLFQPLQIRSVTLKNRLAVSPMCQYSSVDGFASDWHLVHLGSRAIGGAALVFCEATAVSPEGRITPDDLGIWQAAHIVFLKRITDFIISQNAVPGIQLAHAGRKASHFSPWKSGKALQPADGAWQTVAPSAIPYHTGEPAPREMSIQDIKKVVADFRQAAIFALEAGFKIVEIHAAHGYLINNFLSPLSNKRSDIYGGSFENRTRLLFEVIEAIRTVWPEDLPLFVRISASDWAEGGWNITDSVDLGLTLKEKGIDLVDCSSGGNSAEQKIPVAPMYQVEFAAQVKKEAGILTGAVGLITTAQQAEAILQSERADIILLARQMLRDPYFPLHAAFELDTDISWPNQYLRAKLV